MNYDVLHNFISPVTGRVLSDPDYVLVGDKQGIATPSPILIDLRLDLENLTEHYDRLVTADFIIGHPNKEIPGAQVLSTMEDGFMYNTGGIVSTINTPPLPDLQFNNIWIGDVNNRPTEIPYNAAPDNATYILQTPSAGLTNSQALNELGGGILKTTPLSNGAISIASGGKVPIVNDYVRPIDLVEEIEAANAFATAEAAAAEAAAIAASTLYFNEQMLPFSAIPLVPAGAAITTAIAAAVLPKEDKTAHDADINAVNDRIDNLSVNLVGDVLGSGLISSPVATVFKPNPVFTGNESMTIPVGTDEQRPETLTPGMIRFNTSL